MAALLGDLGQFIGVLLILAAAVGYLTLYYQRKFKGKSDAGCSSCGIPLRRAQQQDAHRAGAARQFIPAENLAHLAERRRVEQASQEANDPPPSTGPADGSGEEERR